MGSKDKIFYPKTSIEFNGIRVDLSVPKIMGIVNVTPDSFYAESRSSLEIETIGKCEEMVSEGVSILDIGGYSSRPGASEISVKEEIDRTAKVIKELAKRFPSTMISIDTFRNEVAHVAIENGVSMINDISGGELDPKMHELVVKHNIPYVLMHMKGNPSNMQNAPTYQNVTEEVVQSLQSRLTELKTAKATQIIIDPGFGFGKTLEQNYQLLNNLPELASLDVPILVGFSRKSMIYKLLDGKPETALNGTSVLNTISLSKGAQILRVHDVKEANECIKLWSACSNQD
jgi:dihydropteroate synthase